MSEEKQHGVIVHDNSDGGKSRYPGANTITVKDGHLLVCTGTEVVAIQAPGDWRRAAIAEW